jgi:hypothetical protein
MERSEEGDAREIAAWQIAGPTSKLCPAAALSDKIYTGADIVDSLFQVGWGILNDGFEIVG